MIGAAAEVSPAPVTRPRKHKQERLGLEARPVIKSAGGKGRLLPILRRYIPSAFGRYLEPFVGGGALYFDLHNAGRLGTTESTRPVLCDLNVELIDTYAALVHDVEQVIFALRMHELAHKTDARSSYYLTRARFNDPVGPLDLWERAAMFLYLNRTCFNGLWRVNLKSGAFNVPMGDYKNPTICDAERLRAATRALRGAKMFAGDYRTITGFAQRGDFCYFDSPYYKTFASYTRGGFAAEDQEQLASEAGKLADRGVHVLLSNNDTPLIRELYRDWLIAEISAPRAIAASGDRRGSVAELLIASYPAPCTSEAGTP